MDAHLKWGLFLQLLYLACSHFQKKILDQVPLMLDCHEFHKTNCKNDVKKHILECHPKFHSYEDQACWKESWKRKCLPSLPQSTCWNSQLAAKLLWLKHTARRLALLSVENLFLLTLCRWFLCRLHCVIANKLICYFV